MTGLWEILLIGLVLASIVVPYFNKKKEAQRLAEQNKKNTYKAPDAREVDYEDE